MRHRKREIKKEQDVEKDDEDKNIEKNGVKITEKEHVIICNIFIWVQKEETEEDEQEEEEEEELPSEEEEEEEQEPRQYSLRRRSKPPERLNTMNNLRSSRRNRSRPSYREVNFSRDGRDRNRQRRSDFKYVWNIYLVIIF